MLIKLDYSMGVSVYTNFTTHYDWGLMCCYIFSDYASVYVWTGVLNTTEKNILKLAKVDV